MIRETTADIIRRRRGLRPMDDINDELAAGTEPRIVQVPLSEEDQQAMLDAKGPAVPPRTPLVPRPGSVPAQVGQSMLAAAPPPDLDAQELEAANEADRQSRFTAGMELAGRQLVGAITRTPVSQGIGANPSQVPQAQAAIKSRSERAAEVLRNKRLATNDAQAIKDKQLDRDAKAAAIIRAEREKAAGTERAERFHADSMRVSSENAEASRRMAGAALGLGRERFEAEERERKQSEKEREQKIGADIPPGFEVSAGANPSAETRKKFTALVGSSGKMQALTARMREALKGTTGYSRTMDPKTVTKLRQLGEMIRVEGKNVAGLGALSGPDMGIMNAIAKDPTSVIANLTTDLPAMLDQLDQWGEDQVSGESKATGIVRKASEGQPASKTPPVLMRDPKTGEVFEVE